MYLFLNSAELIGVRTFLGWSAGWLGGDDVWMEIPFCSVCLCVLSFELLLVLDFS